MLNIQKSLTYTFKENEEISKLDLKKGNSWKIQTNAIKKIKKRLRKRLDILQKGRCAYCGNSLYVTSALEIEHIAPKKKELYPEFTYHNKNLVAACSFCNGCHKKHATDIVSKKNAVYEECEFKIVHPYLDNVDNHIMWTDERKIIIDNVNSTIKGKYTIHMFKLGDKFQSLARAKDYHFMKMLEGTPYEGKILSNEDIANIMEELL